MQYTQLGRTELNVSVAGLGCGGHSRLGMARGETENHAADVVRHALSLGINFIDTALAYGTEGAVGKAIAGQRSDVVISTKTPAGRDTLFTAQQITDNLETSLKALGTDYVDVFNLHGVTQKQYQHVVNEQLPELKRQQELGKIRFLGVTELFNRDPHHKLLQQSLADDHFDVIMVGFNFLNPGARHTVFTTAQEKRVGTQIMFAVRRALATEEGIQEVVNKLIEAGEIDATTLNGDHGLRFVNEHPDVNSLTEAAYRFCRHEPGADVILTGTGSKAHLEDNISAIMAGPLPDDILSRLQQTFGKGTSATGN